VVRQPQLSIQKYHLPPRRGTKTSKPNLKVPNARQIGRVPSPQTVREAPIPPSRRCRTSSPEARFRGANEKTPPDCGFRTKKEATA
jgi:hypothetical protein